MAWFVILFLPRFSPSFLIFILTSMPSLWLLEMRRVAQRRLASSSNHNTTDSTLFERIIERIGNDELASNGSLPHNILMKQVIHPISYIEYCLFCVFIVAYQC